MKNSVIKIIGKITARFFITLLVIIISLLIFTLGCISIVFKGPSTYARDLLVISSLETSALKFLPYWYFSEDEVDAIIKANTMTETLEITDQSLVKVPDKKTVEEIPPEEELKVVDISGTGYKGKLLIIKDPSRVALSIPDSYGSNCRGLSIAELAEKENAVAAINAGGFADENGMGSGGQPLGLVIKGGKVAYDNGGSSVVIGFDTDNKLVVGNMTRQQAEEKNLRDACTFGPVFIVNGKRVDTIGSASGVNPRTCIGQTADGTVLMLTIDGRQASSLGATYADCIDILEEYGAVNAANLDGGSSTVLYYNGEIVNVCASVYGPRDLPTAFIVKQKEE